MWKLIARIGLGRIHMSNAQEDPVPNRYLSPAMHDQDAMALLLVPLVGVEATIYNDIWNAVIDRKLPPGTKLEEIALSEIYGISRTVVRKVLAIMEQEGVVTLPSNRGAYIASLTLRDVEELLEAVDAAMTHIVTRLALEPSRISDEQRQNLDTHTIIEEVADVVQDFHTTRRLHIEYLLLLSLVHGNLVIARALERNLMRLATGLSTYQAAPATERSAEFSAKLTRHILNGDPETAVACLVANSEAVRRTLHAPNDDGEIDLRSILRAATTRCWA